MDGVVLLWGESAFLVRDAADELVGEGGATVLDAAEWTAGATADLATPSLFGERRALIVTDAQDLRKDAVTEAAAYAADPAPGTLLVLGAIVSGRAKGPPAVLSRALRDRAEVRRVAVERKDLPSWIRRRAEGHGLAATPQGATALIETVGQDPGVLDQALSQVASAHRAEGLTPETVAAQFRGFGDRRIWELCDAAFGRNPGAALRILRAMIDAREEPLAILGGIASRLRELIRVRALPPELPPAEIATRAGLRFDWQARRYRDQARRFSQEELAELHGRATWADEAVKQGAAGDVVLTMLVTRIAEEPVATRT